MRTGFAQSVSPGVREPRTPPRGAENPIVAQQAVPTAKENRYVLQFRSYATPQQRSALLAKYGLTVQRELPRLNIVVVTRVAPPNEPPPKTLSEVFNPPIILNLRRESIIENATVDSASAPRTIPRPSDTKAKGADGVVRQWSWAFNPVTGPNSADQAAAMQSQMPDGNWGLKYIRMTPVWTIIKNFRTANPNAVKPKMAIIDTGFTKHEDLAVNLLPTPNKENPSDTSGVITSVGPICDRAHGNHVAGIAGGIFGNGIGVDGIIPDAKIDAIPVTDNVVPEGAARGMPLGTSPERLADELALRTAYFSLVLYAVQDYVSSVRDNSTDLRVVNISMGLNLWKLVDAGFDPEEVKATLKDTLQQQAQMLVGFMTKYEDSVLFVVAAGNDSDYFPTPLEAKWASSLAWLAAGEINKKFYKQPKNILVVEAIERNGQRASFSNINGQIAAPGVEILSTLLTGDNAYAVCDGTSQATPFAAAVATLMFELSPSKKPAEIIDIMVKAARPKPEGALGAPQLDALEAILRLSPYTDWRNENLIRLTDLNGDGKVDIVDLKEYVRQLGLLDDNRVNGTAFAEDLNGDTVTDANECKWPTIDFNGSGTASLSHSDAKRVLGEYRNDLAIMQMAWTDKTKDSAAAIKELGFNVQAADVINPRISPQACR
jgi:hypothetical protein